MTATYGDAQIYNSSRVTYNGAADDTTGAGIHAALVSLGLIAA